MNFTFQLTSSPSPVHEGKLILRLFGTDEDTKQRRLHLRDGVDPSELQQEGTALLQMLELPSYVNKPPLSQPSLQENPQPVTTAVTSPV